MGRFEREEIEARRLPTPLGTATEDLRSTIEAEVTKIVSRAEARAAEIEDQALEKASRIERESERRSQTVLRESRERLGQMLDEIGSIERSVGDSTRSLRAEAERLSAEIDAALEEPLDLPLPEPAPLDERPVEEALPPEPEPEPDDVTPPEAASGSEDEPYVTDFAETEVREMIRQQLVSLADSGRNRADAERMLLRFRQGERYFDLLDEIYPEETPGRRGILRRRK
jgi:hypothetical protein